MTPTTDSRARLGTYEPSSARYSRRLPKAKYLQRLLLDTARALMPVLHRSGENQDDAVSLDVTPAAVTVVHHGLWEPGTPVLRGQDGDRLVVLADALSRQMARLTGCGSFELRTWVTSVPTQPVQMRLRTEAGGALEIFNPRATANRYFHGLKALSEMLAEKFGNVARAPGDLDRLVASGEIPGWQAFSAEAIRDYHKTFPHLAKKSAAHTIDLFPTAVAQSRARLGAATPAVIAELEAYEVELERSIVHRFSRWGQDEHKAPERTAKRQKKLNPQLTGDLVPLSRSLKETSPEELMQLANDRPLTHLAIEFGVSEPALRKRLDKLGWISPRGWAKRRKKLEGQN